MQAWVRFAEAGATRFGTLQGDTVEVHEGDMYASPRPTGERRRLSDITLLCPAAPSKVVVMYNNFAALVDKLQQPRPTEPQYLLKGPNACLPHGGVIRRPAFDSRIIFEGELGVVVGRRCKDVDEAQAAEHVFGYTCANDVTAADVLTRDPGFAHWVRAKGFDGSCPFGPAVVTGLDPGTLVVRTLLDGRVRQQYPLSDMLFTVPQIISRISHDMTLEPGDLVLCGTSVGVGVMKPGSTVEVAIEGIGSLVNRFEPPTPEGRP